MEKEYLASAEDVLEAQSSNAETGLTGAVAQQRLSEFGPNKLDEEEKTPLWKRFFEQMADPMVIMLIVAAAISAITGTIQGEPEWADVIIILTVVVINSVLGVVQEAKSEQALAALQEMSAAQSKVIRDGKMTVIDGDYDYYLFKSGQLDGPAPTDESLVDELMGKGGSGKGGNAGRQSAELEMKEEMWTCVQGAEVTVPEQDELYDRRADPFQLNNLAGEHPEKAKELLQQLKLYIGELRTL